MEKVKGYSSNLNVQMLISLMIENDIRKVIISPGGTHNEMVASLQYNGGFELYSTVDERGAAYMACGMAAESGEAVVILCTESVASRNYYPAITEAYYRKLPILAITATRGYDKIGHLKPQVIDRSDSPKDTFKLKVHLPQIKDKTDMWMSNVLINKAILELWHRGTGPVHIDLPKTDGGILDFSSKQLFNTRVIRRYTLKDKLPTIPKVKIAVFIGTHKNFTVEQSKILDLFCMTYNAVVFCGHTSGYNGKYKVLSNLLAIQKKDYDIFNEIDLLIHIGEHASDEATENRLMSVKEVWRISPDGEIRDTFKKLTNVFEMDEESFFRYYSDNNCEGCSDYFNECVTVINHLTPPLEKLPFSNVYIASIISQELPQNSVIHLGLSNTIRSWSMFDFPKKVKSYCNTGTRGIDGVLSAFIGASFVNANKLYFCVIGDLSFFYDLNSLGNRSISNNIRILLINDGGGGLFKLSNIDHYKYIGVNDTNPYIAAVGHFGHQSKTLVKSFSESLGFEYISASDKEEFLSRYKRFVTPEITDKPMLFEIFTKDYQEREAFDIMSSIDVSAKAVVKKAIKNIVSVKTLDTIKKSIEK